MAEPGEPPIEYELLRQATLAEIVVADTQINPTSADDKHVRIEVDSDSRRTRTASRCVAGPKPSGMATSQRNAS
jgi:hypothetical protein